ncbi:MAG: hypothetical protein V3U30_05400 [Thermoplasmata archaeon]
MQPRWRSLILRIYPFLLVASGILLSFAALTSEVELVGRAAVEGTAQPGDNSQSVNRTDYGAVVLESDSLPCELLVYPLASFEHETYLHEGELPSQTLNCDRPFLVLDRQVSHLVLRNLDPVDSFDYNVTLTFYRTTRPLAWVAFPALGLLSVGSVIILVGMLVRGLEKATKPTEKDR